MRRRAWPAVAALLLLPGCMPSPADAPRCEAPTRSWQTPPLPFTGLVVDQAHLLPADRMRSITERLDRLQQTTGRQVAVVTVTSLGGEDITRFTTRLANAWGVGRAGINDGTVLLVAPHERKVRIGVGCGLTTVLTDRIAGEIIQRTMLPRFERGDLAGGIEAGVTAITDRLSATPPRP